MLTIFTIVVCVVSYLLNISAFLTYFSYVLAFTILKAFLTKRLKDVYNIRKAEAIYMEVGFMNTLDSFISLLVLLSCSFSLPVLGNQLLLLSDAVDWL